MTLLKATIAVTAVLVCLCGQYPGQNAANPGHNTSQIKYR